MRFVSFAVAATVVVLSSCVQPSEADAGTPTTIVTIAGANGAAGAFADGRAGEARFDLPEGLALDATGENLFIADSVNHVIRRLELATGEVTTIAGEPTQSGFADSDADGGARLHLPRNLVLAPGGRSLYFTDTGNSVIRSLELDGGRVSTVFGTPRSPGANDGRGLNARFGKSGLFGALPWGGGLVIDESDANRPLMYVADSANQLIRVINLVTGDVTTIAGRVGVEGAADGPALEATFNKPSGLALQGNALFITEANNLTIRRLELGTRQVLTVAGKAPENPKHFCENVSPVLPPECGSTDSPNGLEARFRFPFGVTPDDRGGFFVVDSHNNLIRRFDPASTAVTTVAGKQLTVLHDLIHPSEDTGPGQEGTFSHPSNAVFVPPRTLYVADRSANCIRRVELAD
jgi:sugar lactone lactonase YvrE